MVYLKCGDYVFDPKVTRVQFQDEISADNQNQLITITGLIKSSNLESLNSEINTLIQGIYHSPVTLYYPTAQDSTKTKLLSFTYTPHINGKSVAFEIKLGQDKKIFQGASVNHVFNNLGSGSLFTINYLGSKNTSLRLKIAPLIDISDLVLSNSQKERGRFLGNIAASSVLLLDQENSGITLDQVDAWLEYEGDLFTLAEGNNQFVLEFSGGGAVSVITDYVIRYG